MTAVHEREPQLPRGGWIRGIFEGDYEAAEPTQWGDAPPGARVLAVTVLRGVVRNTSTVSTPVSPHPHDLRQRTLRAWVEVGADGAGLPRVHELVLHEVRITDWTVEPLLDERSVSHGHVRGVLWARVGTSSRVAWPLGCLALFLLALALALVAVRCGHVGALRGEDVLSNARGALGRASMAVGTVLEHAQSVFGSLAGGEDEARRRQSATIPARERRGTEGQAREAAAFGGSVEAGQRATLAEVEANPTAFFARCGIPMALDGDLLFDLDQDALRPESRSTLERVGALVRAADDGALRLHIVGHADQRGDDAYNDDLSSRRARRIARWLVGHGAISRERATFAGRGEREPIVTDAGASDEALRPNRRVELVVACGDG